MSRLYVIQVVLLVLGFLRQTAIPVNKERISNKDCAYVKMDTLVLLIIAMIAMCPVERALLWVPKDAILALTMLHSKVMDPAPVIRITSSS